MKHVLSSFVLLMAAIALPRLSGAQTAPSADPPKLVDLTGVWLAVEVPSGPWTFEFKQTGTVLTGTARQNRPGALSGPVPVHDGAVTGTSVSFQIDSPDGARTITLSGSITGNEIRLHRATKIHSELSAGGTALFGTDAAPEFTIKRAVSGAERWVASDGVAFSPWTFDLKIDGGTVTGVAGQSASDVASGYVTSMAGPFEIYDGKVDGSAIDFKLKTSDGGRIITFHGVRTGDQITFTRAVNVVGGDPGRDGITGATGATSFIAKLETGKSKTP